MKALVFSLFVFSLSAGASPVLDKVLSDVSARGKGIVIMDLDETVLDSHSRKYNAYLAAWSVHCGDPEATIAAPASQDCERLLGLSKADFYKVGNGYSSYELMGRLKVGWTEFIAKFSKTMVDEYLSGKWLEEDSPMPGANTYVRELKRRGAEVYFITSRFEDTQKEGSLARLKALGFMQAGEEDHLILRKRGQDSLDFKARAVALVRAESESRNVPVIGLFENEPENLNVWKKTFPQAAAVLIKGNILVNVEPSKEVHVVDDYR